jgi:hypothetical protein
MKWRIGRASDPAPKPSVREQERTDAVLTCSCLALSVLAILGALVLLTYGVWRFFEDTKRTIPISI